MLLQTPKYQLFAYSIMPNHVHALFQPADVTVATGGPPVDTEKLDIIGDKTTGEPPTAIGEQHDEHNPLARIMHSLKSYTAHRANDILGRAGTFWQAESYDH